MNTTVSILIIRNNKYLLQHRDNKDSIAYPNTYGVWGGAVEKQDLSNEAAAIRELKEETGLIIKASELIFFGTAVWDGSAPQEIGKQVRFYYYALHVQPHTKLSVYEGQGCVELSIPYIRNSMTNMVTEAIIKQYEGHKIE